MSELLLKHNLKTLRLPTMLGQFAKLSREAAESDQSYEDYLLHLTELEVATRSANALSARRPPGMVCERARRPEQEGRAGRCHKELCT